MNQIFIGSLFFIYGIFLGSFFNVVADRWLASKTIKGRSKCDNCGYTLKPQNLVPIFSFMFQKGKCSNCKTKLSYYYPLSELMTGISFFTVYMAYGLSANTLLGIVFLTTLIISALTDAKEGFVLDRVVIPPTIIMVFIVAFLKTNLIFYTLLPALIVFGFCLIAVKYEKMGSGDVTLISATFLVHGLILGPIAMLISSSVALIYMLFNRKKSIPFIPFWFIGNYSIYLMISLSFISFT